MIRPLLCLPLVAAFSFGAVPAKAEATTLVKAAMKLHELTGGRMCQPDRGADEDDSYKEWTFSHDLYPGAAAESEEITLIRIWCSSGAYNTQHAYYTYRAYEGLTPLSFAEPTIKYEHQENAPEEAPTPFNLIGMQGTLTLTNSEYDPQTHRITEHALWRGVGDASSTGIWEFAEGEWALVYYEIDTSYDGGINPVVVVDYRKEAE